jgi:hypothetical protein
MFVDISYLPNQAYNFFGWNGYESVYNMDWEDRDLPDSLYRTAVFYRYENKMFRFKSHFQGMLTGNLKWQAGLQWYNYNIGTVDIDRLNKGKKAENQLPPVSEQPLLYDKYREWGLITEEESEGGDLAECRIDLRQPRQQTQSDERDLVGNCI